MNRIPATFILTAAALGVATPAQAGALFDAPPGVPVGVPYVMQTNDGGDSGHNSQQTQRSPHPQGREVTRRIPETVDRLVHLGGQRDRDQDPEDAPAPRPESEPWAEEEEM